jgi:hypothetical protein
VVAEVFSPHAADPTDDIPDIACCMHGTWCPEQTAKALATKAGLERPGWTYDPALPQYWVDEVRERTGINPVGMGIVMAYGPRGSGYHSGNLFALTIEASVLIAWAKSLGISA